VNSLYDDIVHVLGRVTGFRPLDLIKMMRERREEEAVTAAPVPEFWHGTLTD